VARVIRREAPASAHRQGIEVEFGVTETADYVISGRIRVVYGLRLENVIEAGPGEFVYVPANEAHYVENPSPTEWVEVVLCRNAATEIVVDYQPPA